ncbi:aminopeptidase N [Methanocalculus alkaliphilus]|nr:aminopeptidase N [Methanocalculus alkaliphilus]
MPARFRYYRSDITPSPVDVIHMDLTFRIEDDQTRVAAVTRFRSRDHPIRTLRLNARNLDILEFSSPGHSIDLTQDEDGILITFLREIPGRTEFLIASETICRPSSTLLEGLYYDETPPGAPPTQITQCQQWGFQRLVPCIDEMTAKCTYRTTIIADARYTHLISNGDVAIPRHQVSPTRDEITYENTTTPMAPYLFFLGAGTYDSFQRTFEYPSGRTFLLELLCPPGSDPERAEEALDILEDSIIWVYLFTGPHQYDQLEIRYEIYRLYKKRAYLRRGGAQESDLEQLTHQMKKLDDQIVCGYAYTGSVYREIGMQNSDFGGMENVGNTTISTNRLMPFPEMTDAGFEYLLRVKVHEFYHNLNGSEVTGESPFEIWLNEAATVHIEDQYHAFHFGEAYTRLQRAIALMDPVDGTFSRETGAAAMPIEPDGFNDPNDLITPVTYVKAPEFIRMIESILGKEAFAWALSVYHRKYAHGNAGRNDFITLMSSIAGMDLGPMAEGWLKRAGYPTLSITTRYDEKDQSCHITLLQSGDGIPWEFPFDGALMHADGREIEKFHHLITKRREEITITPCQPPAYYSFNRGLSFYGTVEYNADAAALFIQARTDPDIIARFGALQALLRCEMQFLAADPAATPSRAFIALFIELLSDTELMSGAGAPLLTIFEGGGDPAAAHRYREVYQLRVRLERGIAHAEGAILRSLYRAYQGSDGRWRSIGRMAREIKTRQVKNLCLRLLARINTPEIHTLIREQFSKSQSATDRMTAYLLLLNSDDPERHQIFCEMMEEARHNLVAWEQFLAATASSDAANLVQILREIEASPYFRIDQANDQRALYGRFARNRKISLETEEGRIYLGEILSRLQSVNEYSTANILAVFAHIDRMDAEHHLPLIGILASLLQETESSAIRQTLQRLIAGNPAARASYIGVHGPIPGIE